MPTHIGNPAVVLRLLGIDTGSERDAADEEPAQRAEAEQRAVLAPNRGLPKRSLVTHGSFLHDHAPRRQVLEVLRHVDLTGVPGAV